MNSAGYTYKGETSIGNFSDEWGDLEYEDEDELVSVIEFSFTEGNYSCDCNRRLFVLRAKGEDPDVMSSECGDSIKLTKLTLIRPDKTEINIL